MFCSHDSTASSQGWTADRVDALREHHSLGLTAAQSAILLETTKNAVVAKRYRLGLAALAKPIFRCLPEPPRRSRAPLFRAPPAFPAEPLPEMDGPLPADAAPVTLAKRRADQCAWPLGPADEAGDWRTLFCGAPVARDSFCACHAARAYQ